ncbi:MAG: DUF86 domain-containing protein [Muribaculaceae bacterium]|nr:DUF86 domain-containing protein [Muribaculaceae bacterium]
MREKVKDPGRIRHMLDAAKILSEEIPKHSLDSIQKDRILFFGLAKLIEIIGEAAYKLTLEFRNDHSELPWNAIIGMRHVMVHDYYTMSPQKIWTTIVSDIPEMIPILERYLEEFDSNK